MNDDSIEKKKSMMNSTSASILAQYPTQSSLAICGLECGELMFYGGFKFDLMYNIHHDLVSSSLIGLTHITVW